MIYCFDVDGTICTLMKDSNYLDAEPFEDVLAEINSLYEKGNKIIIMTARGSVSGKDWSFQTVKQLQTWGVRYHELIMNKKPHADIFIDDKGMNIIDWRASLNQKVGFVAGSFDVIHPGYISMFRDAKSHCDKLVVALQENSALERPSKIPPILSIKERRDILESIVYVDEVVEYQFEKDLYDLLKDIKPDVRFLGDDYGDKGFTGDDLNIEVCHISRDHGWSTTKFKNMIKGNV